MPNPNPEEQTPEIQDPPEPQTPPEEEQVNLFDEDPKALAELEDLRKQFVEEEPQEEETEETSDSIVEDLQKRLSRSQGDFATYKANWGGLVTQLEPFGDDWEAALPPAMQAAQAKAAQQNQQNPYATPEMQGVPYVNQGQAPQIQPNPVVSREIQDLKTELAEIKEARKTSSWDSQVGKALQGANLQDDPVAQAFISNGPQDKIDERIRLYQSQQKKNVASVLSTKIQQLKERQEDSVESSPGIGLIAEVPEDLRSDEHEIQTREAARDNLSRALGLTKP